MGVSKREGRGPRGSTFADTEADVVPVFAGLAKSGPLGGEMGTDGLYGRRRENHCVRRKLGC
jgi:hypothetical protein